MNARRSVFSAMSFEIGFPAPWPAAVSTRSSTGVSHAWAALQGGGELERMARNHPVVVVAGQQQGRRVAGAGPRRCAAASRRAASANCSGSSGLPKSLVQAQPMVKR